MLHDLIEQAAETLRLPEIIGERCVHSHIENASCRSCVEVCPKDAWLLDDEQLGIDAEACDGCGLCAAVCTEGAIVHNHEPQIGHWKNRILALLACEKSETPEAQVIPCVHALGLHNLLALYCQGCRYLFVSTGECEQCFRAESISLGARVKALNSMLEQRGLTPLKFKYLPSVKWGRIVKTLNRVKPQETVSRRNFLCGSLANAVDKGMTYSRLQDVEKAEFIPVGDLLPPHKQTDIQPFVVQIDAQRCNGCDACARLCPHEAISLIKEENGNHYSLNSQRCTGCNICIDACDQAAVQVVRWAIPTQTTLSLISKNCRSCGAPFHLPVEHSSEELLCRICVKINHNKNLFQVID
jgi:MinD superfamily P-loop ATPase